MFEPSLEFDLDDVDLDNDTTFCGVLDNEVYSDSYEGSHAFNVVYHFGDSTIHLKQNNKDEEGRVIDDEYGGVYATASITAISQRIAARDFSRFAKKIGFDISTLSKSNRELLKIVYSDRGKLKYDSAFKRRYVDRMPDEDVSAFFDSNEASIEQSSA